MLKTQKIHDHLSKHLNNVIEIFDTETSEKLVSKINLSKIEESAENLDMYFKSLHADYSSVKTFGVQLFTSNGTTHKRTGYPISVAFNHTQQEMPKEVASAGISATTDKEVAPPVANSTPPATPSYQMPQPAYYPNPNPGLMGAMGLGMPEIIDLKTKAARFDETRELLRDIKDELREEKAKNNLLTIDLRNADSKIAVAEQVKILAVQAAEMSNKGLMDSSGFKELVTQLGKITPAILKNQQAGGGLAGSQFEQETYSDDKEGLIDLIKDEKFTDQIAIQLVYVAVGLQKLPKFGIELKELVEKHKIIETIN